MSKYKNIKYGKYDSKKEKYRADTLKMLEKQGIISNLKEQVKYELIPAQYHIENGKRKCIERSCVYIADFTYLMQGEFIVEDVKGVRTKDYVIKRKLMLQLYGIKIKEV